MFMQFTPGDVQLVQNHTILHDRTGFEDWPQPDKRRHLLRLWLAADKARPLPPVFAQRYGSVTVGDRGGHHRARHQVERAVGGGLRVMG